ncbi:30S ribosomal protein S6 [Candidatus Saccharibacteria bacterium]|nr:30S ribosomal protein S6 [Candidatus Saccharibacteria bacterium]
MKEYELTVLIHPDLEMDLDTPLKKVREIITEQGGKITKEDNWGKKKLAYQIQKQDYAVYVLFSLELPASAPLKISGILNITDEVIRYLLVKKDEKLEKMKKIASDKKDKEEQHGL